MAGISFASHTTDMSCRHNFKDLITISIAELLTQVRILPELAHRPWLRFRDSNQLLIMGDDITWHLQLLRGLQTPRPQGLEHFFLGFIQHDSRVCPVFRL